ncbi:hypothetical protein [Paenibacillus ginsengarvi]|uniref:DUF4177 domain-containing protein n=1 Tax=Paenibacillus ginsengarvi TaxID=400777 RepID=A0A3B0CKC9_9BACL|nr:hypothetical protein [Paenibacillus ginsengarvi]RKN84787.1 hypothetical protein D7M11_12450 [Paenibacillus ginsengarvi]
MTRWEYTILDNPGRLNELGEEGWELVGVTSAEGGERFYLKRPLPSLREQITLDQRKMVLDAAEGGGGE